MRFRLMAVALAVLATAGTPAFAQNGAESDANGEQRSPPPNGADTAEVGLVAKAQRWVEEKRIVERLAPREGLYARFGGMVTGSGLAVGAGYRRNFLDERIFGDFSAALSTKWYKAVDAKARWGQFWGDRIELWSEFRYRDYPEEDYFGLGEDSSRDNRIAYAIESTDILGRVVVKPLPWLHFGADLGYFNPNISRGRDGGLPSIEERFSDLDAPGLDEQPDFLHNTVFGEVDYRDQRGHPTRGGFYRASFGTWEDVTLQSFDHHRFDADAAQFFPIRPRHVLGLHVGLSYVNNETGHRVPFYFLPYIGGSETLRGFREFRFRDENILFMNAEYRIQLHRYVHVATFVDAGEVRADWQDIGPSGLKASYGVGIRGGTDDRIFFRVDVGTGGGEGVSVFFKFGPSF